MQTILITGGRAPVALDFARKFKHMGWRVLVAESMPVHLCQNSRAVDDCFTVPSPRFEAEQFISTLCHIIQQENVDLLLPTCEGSVHHQQGLLSIIAILYRVHRSARTTIALA